MKSELDDILSEAEATIMSAGYIPVALSLVEAETIIEPRSLLVGFHAVDTWDILEYPFESGLENDLAGHVQTVQAPDGRSIALETKEIIEIADILTLPTDVSHIPIFAAPQYCIDNNMWFELQELFIKGLELRTLFNLAQQVFKEKYGTRDKEARVHNGSLVKLGQLGLLATEGVSVLQMGTVTDRNTIISFLESELNINVEDATWEDFIEGYEDLRGIMIDCEIPEFINSEDRTRISNKASRVLAKFRATLI